ncbi:TPA: hypothetical protein QDB40_003516 [Burkholderia vietnamiensis]|nr:hypothetical protein [Burkholderia vietnamiensis]
MNIAVMVVIGVLWFLVAAVLNQSDVLHEKGLPALAFGAAVFNPILLLFAMLIMRS